jgi:SAM-dependent methyltransferase
MNLNSYLKRCLGERDLSGKSPGSPDFFRAQLALIKRKPLLKRSYLQFYETFRRDLDTVRAPGTKVLELGSGGGFLKEIIPQVITSDIYDGVAELEIDARSIPFAGGEIRGLFLASVLHHVPDVEAFFSEAYRVLCLNGICAIVEPCNTPFARLFYRHFHHEPFLPDAHSWRFAQSDAMMDSNQALSWIVFERDQEKFRELFPGFAVERKIFLPTLGYILSGGVNYRPLWPSALSGVVAGAERCLSRCDRWFSLLWYILLRKVS